MKPINIQGKRLGIVTTLFPLGSEGDGEMKWLALCDCGKEFIVKASEFNRKEALSCGCSKRRRGHLHPGWKGYRLISGQLWTSIKRGAKNRRIRFEISIQDAWDLFEKQKGLCALSGIELRLEAPSDDLRSRRSNRTASLDRIDSYKGYAKNNLQWVHKDLNRMKLKTDNQKFINWCKLVAKHNDS